MSLESQMALALQGFVIEGRELLTTMEGALLDLDALVSAGDGDGAAPGDPAAVRDAVAEIFRAAHTLKGSAGLFGLDHVVRFTHVLESVLARLRAGDLAPDRALIGELLPCVDHVSALLTEVASGSLAAVPGHLAESEALLAALRPYLDEPDDAPGPARPDASAAAVVAPAPGASRRVRIVLRPDLECLRDGLDPLPLIACVEQLGDLRAVRVLDGALPPLAELDPEQCHLGFDLDVLTCAPRAAIEEIFEFVRERSRLEIHEGLPDAASAPGPAAPAAGVSPADGERRVPRPRRGAERGATNIRVAAARLDRLVDAVGELVIAGAGAASRAAASGDVALVEALGEVMRHVEQVRDGALQLRMVPIRATFDRFHRVVRDVGAQLGKDIVLVTSGGDAEIDRALVEQVADPLMHLVRNAIDHGIEPVQQRLERGKPARATVRLAARHKAGSIVVEVGDDGGGIDPEAVRRRAVERGLVAATAALSARDCFDLIFEPGLSTAAEVTNLSGRGVGLDVVRRNVTALRGSIEVESEPGVGTTFRVRLPLTLSIIAGFGVGVGGATYVVPLEQVVECVELPVQTRSAVMDLRGEVLPFVRLRQLFGADGARARRQSVVVVQHAGTRVGLVVDSLVGELQTVVKPLGGLFAHVPGIGGATILGTGEIALVVDVPTLVDHVTSHPLGA